MKLAWEIAMEGGWGSVLILVLGGIDLALLWNPRTRARATGGPVALVAAAFLISFSEFYARYSQLFHELNPTPFELRLYQGAFDSSGCLVTAAAVLVLRGVLLAVAPASPS